MYSTMTMRICTVTSGLATGVCDVRARDVLLFSNLLFYNSYLVVAVATCYSFLEVTG
jgi:hypothetical protein